MGDAHVFGHNRNGMLFLLFCCVITIHGFHLQDALDIADCLALCRNVSEPKFYSIVPRSSTKSCWIFMEFCFTWFNVSNRHS